MFKKVMGQIEINKFFKKPGSDTKTLETETPISEPVVQN